jgi:hypothetical protein
MMQLVSSVQSDIIDSVFDKVHLITTDAAAPGIALYKDTPSIVTVAATETWEKIRNLVSFAARKGWEAAHEMLDVLSLHIEQVSAELVELADTFRAFILKKLHELIRETFDFVLRSIRSKLEIGESTYVLNTIELETKLVYSNSIEASLTTLCKFIGQGEAVVTGRYTLLGSAQ